MTPLQSHSRFAEIELLGEGRFCDVYRARDLQSGLPVSLKILRAHAQTLENETALHREFRLLSRLNHPNLIQVIDFVSDENLGPCLVFEFFPARPLREMTVPSDVSLLLEVLVQLGRALNFLHARGIVHGDLKPENVLLSTPTPLPTDSAVTPIKVKLIDFGLAAQFAQGKALPPRGTPSFVAPELLRGIPADHRVDLYAFGVLIREMLGPSSDHPASPDSRPYPLQPSSNLREALLNLSLDLMQEDPAKRPSTAADVIEAMAALSGIDFQLETIAGIRAGLSSTGLVGRESDTRKIRAACVRTGAPSLEALPHQPTVILLHGEAGIGKTRILDHIANELRLARLPFERVACPDENALPFHPFRTLVSWRDLPNSARSLDANDSDSLLDTSSAPGWAPFQKLKRFDDLASAIHETLKLSPRALLLDDLHFADEDSFEVFLRLLPKVKSLPVTIVASFRLEGL